MIITGQDLLKLGFQQGPALGQTLALLNGIGQLEERFAQMGICQKILHQPEQYLYDEVWGTVGQLLVKERKKAEQIKILSEVKTYKVYGKAGIEEGAIKQMNNAMRLPITEAGALMPDAHQGYGLPIGGVLATKNAVIPYGVGVDIGCRMCLTLYDVPSEQLTTKRAELKQALIDNTRFGQASFRKPIDHAIIDNNLFQEINILKSLKDRAYSQLGTSGGGNHFVEFGVVEITDVNNEWNLPLRNYLAVLSHSGSRGMGANVARHYTKLAKQHCQLPKDLQHLAWFDMDSELGQEYWLAMNLAGDYASACHHQIHDRLAAAIGGERLALVENHHNFAWKEKNEAGEEIIVHRKGATPAGKGVLGIIPGSMTAPGFIVRGKGNAASINSASHGAGRQMSRTKAQNNLKLQEVKKHIHELGVEVIGSGLDEAPMAYKDIHKVMKAQTDLVEVVGSFTPKIVRMCGDENFYQH